MNDSAADGRILLGVRIGVHPAEVLVIHQERQANLEPSARADDPSSPQRRVDRSQYRDATERLRERRQDD